MLGLGTDITSSSYVSMDLKDATTDLELWLKNDTGVAVGQWDDSSGNNNHVKQNTEANQAAVSGGGLDFESGDSDHYTFTKITISANQGFCLALVITRESSSAASILGDSSNELIQFNNAHDLRIKTNAPSNVTTDAKFETNTFAAGSKFLVLINRSENKFCCVVRCWTNCCFSWIWNKKSIWR